MDNRFYGVIARHELDPDVFIGVFSKCKEHTALFGDEYFIGEQLFKIGLMEVTRTPLWNKNQSYIGNKVTFKSLFL
jgi:hypothetical protein